MNIVAFSDLHGQLPTLKKSADIALIAGDVTPLQIQSSFKVSEKWFLSTFKEWAEALPVDHVFFIAGNHDFYLEEVSKSAERINEFNAKLGDKITYIYNEVYECGEGKYGNTQGVRILGTPLCHVFGGWAFMPSDEKMKKAFNDIQLGGKVDIFLTHDAPYGTSDRLLQKTFYNPVVPGKHIGSVPLKEFIEVVEPSYCFHGHLHSTNHEVEKLGKTAVYNVSLLDERYELVYEPLYINI